MTQNEVKLQQIRKIRHHSMSAIGNWKERKNYNYENNVSNNVIINVGHDEKKSDDDDENDDKKLGKIEYRIRQRKFILNNRYYPKKIIDSCVYHTLCEAIDRKNNDKKVLVKKYKDVFNTIDESKNTLREIKLLMHFEHPDVKYFYINISYFVIKVKHEYMFVVKILEMIQT